MTWESKDETLGSVSPRALLSLDPSTLITIAAIAGNDGRDSTPKVWVRKMGTRS